MNFAGNLNFEVIELESDIYWSKEYLEASEGYLYNKFDAMFDIVFVSHLYGAYDKTLTSNNFFKRVVKGSISTDKNWLFNPDALRYVFREHFE